MAHPRPLPSPQITRRTGVNGRWSQDMLKFCPSRFGAKGKIQPIRIPEKRAVRHPEPRPMTTRRTWAVAAIVLIAVAAVATASVIVFAKSSSQDDVDPRSVLLTQSDFPSGYVVSALNEADSGPTKPDRVTPANCQRALDDQFRRNKMQKNLTILSDDERRTGSPRFAQTVADNGESVDDALSVVRDCPRRTEENSDGMATIEGKIRTAPPNCPGDGAYVRLARTQTAPSDGSSPPTEYLMGYLHAGRVVSVLSQITAATGQSDTQLFCALMFRASERLHG